MKNLKDFLTFLAALKSEPLEDATILFHDHERRIMGSEYLWLYADLSHFATGCFFIPLF